MKCFTITKVAPRLEFRDQITVARSNAHYLAVGDTKIMVADNALSAPNKADSITVVSIRPDGGRIKIVAPSPYAIAANDALVLFAAKFDSWVTEHSVSGIEVGQLIAEDAGKTQKLLSMRAGQEFVITLTGKTVTSTQVKLPKPHWWSRQPYATKVDEQPRQEQWILHYNGRELSVYAPKDRVETKVSADTRDEDWQLFARLSKPDAGAADLAAALALLTRLADRAESEPASRALFVPGALALTERFSALGMQAESERAIKLGLRVLYASPEGFAVLDERSQLKAKLIALQGARISLAPADTTHGVAPQSAASNV